MKWQSLEIEPPEEFVEVEDENGNKAFAIPTIYHFKFGKSKTGRKWDSNIIYCDPYWDGGWLIQCEGLDTNIDSSIVKWRKIKDCKK